LEINGGHFAYRFFLIIFNQHTPTPSGDIFKMRPNLKLKFIQHLSDKKKDEGFTLIELLVVIVIIGILAAIALPHFLNNTAKAKQSEGKQNIGLVNKLQNTYREQNKSFASTFDILVIGSIAGGATGSTTNYIYKIGGSADTATITATAQDAALKGYSGAGIRYSNSQNMSVIGTIMCETILNGTSTTSIPDISNVLVAPTCDPIVHKTLNP
jgi:type IV pilus assembly protein PilA